MDQKQRRIFLINNLLAENPEFKNIEVPVNSEDQKHLLRALFNVRPPHPISAEFKKIQDEYLQNELAQEDIVSAKNFPDRLSIWQGDITHLELDAIVNAANNQMTGCYAPNHYCIDNAIHTFAGIELRNACNELMVKQGYPEPTGHAKITKAYNLPSKYVIHTVGPIVEGDHPTKKQEELLSDCYRNSLTLAANYNLTSIAFPCISTGVFHFPNLRAAEIAVQTVKEFMREDTSINKVIFNVFKDEDKIIYEKLLREN